jgi:hypothetical protein
MSHSRLTRQTAALVLIALNCCGLAFLSHHNVLASDITDKNLSEQFPVHPVNGLQVPVEIFGSKCIFLLNTSFNYSAVHDCFYSEMTRLGKPTITEMPVSVPGYELFNAASLRVGSGSPDLSNDVGYEVGLTAAHRAIFLARGPDCKGAIGMDRLKKSVLKINFDDGVFQINTKADPSPDAYQEQIRYRPLIPLILLKVSNAGFQSVNINTGSFGDLLVDTEFFNKLSKSGRLKVTRSSLETSPGKKTTRMGILDFVELGPYRVSNILVEESGPQKSIGLGFLRRFNVELDFPNGIAYFQTNSHFRDPARRDRSGIVVSASQPVSVLVVTPESVGDKAGIRANDVVLALDDCNIEQLSILEVRDLLSEAGKPIKITISREGTRQDIVVPLNDDPDPFVPQNETKTTTADFDFDK